MTVAESPPAFQARGLTKKYGRATRRCSWPATLLTCWPATPGWWRRTVADCAQATNQFRSAHQNTLLFLAAGLTLIPAVLGAFWGAPMIARELENGTHRLVWNQSVTRPRWLLTRLLNTLLRLRGSSALSCPQGGK